MKLNITKGTVNRPQKVVIYAPEGIGKSTLASQLPAPLFLDFEQGSHHLAVDRIEPVTFAETLGILTELSKDSGQYRTLVVDTVDWLEEACVRGLCEKHKKSGIEDFGYGKGYAFLAEEMLTMLSRLDAVSRRMNVVLLAHSEVKRVELPDLPAFDRYQLRLTKTVMPLVKEWADALLFGNYKLNVREPDGSKAKAVGGKERILKCSHSATADAKNRHGLKDEEPWGPETLAKIFKPVSVQAPAAPKPAPQPEQSPAPVSGAEYHQGDDTDPLWAILEPHRPMVQAWLVANQRLTEGQGFEEMDGATCDRVRKDPQRFIRIVEKWDAERAAAMLQNMKEVAA